MKRFLTLGALLLALLTLGACSHYGAMEGPFEGDSINPDFVDRIVDKADDKLDLNDAQEAQFRKAMETMLNKAQSQRDESDRIRTQLADELRKETLDQSKVDNLLERKSELMKNVMESGKQELATFHSMLNADQRDKLAEMVLERGRHGHDW